MRWDAFIIWHHYDWAQILFSFLFAVEIGGGLLLARRQRRLSLSRKAQIGPQIHAIGNKQQQIGSPIGPMSVPRDAGRQSENDHESKE